MSRQQQSSTADSFAPTKDSNLHSAGLCGEKQNSIIPISESRKDRMRGNRWNQRLQQHSPLTTVKNYSIFRRLLRICTVGAESKKTLALFQAGQHMKGSQWNVCHSNKSYI